MTKCNFAGDDKAGASWTDKIMANKSDTSSTRQPGGGGEGAEEDEWVRTKSLNKLNDSHNIRDVAQIGGLSFIFPFLTNS